MGPWDAACTHLKTHEKANIVEFITIDNVAARWGLAVRWGNLYLFANLPKSIGRAPAFRQ